MGYLTDLVTFASGILASGIAALIYDRATRPRLRIEIDQSGRVRDQAQGLHEFHHLIVRNRKAIWPFPGRRPAWSATARSRGSGRIRMGRLAMNTFGLATG